MYVNSRQKRIRSELAIFAVGCLIITGGVYFASAGHAGNGDDRRLVVGSATKRPTKDDPRSDPTNCRQIVSGGFSCTSPEITQKAKQVKKWYVTQETKKVIVTAYNSVEAQTDSTPCIAADGTNICRENGRGVQTCATRLAPLGSTLHVPGWGDCVVHDKTNVRFSDRVDLYFGGYDRIDAAKKWGKQELEVTIVY